MQQVPHYLNQANSFLASVILRLDTYKYGKYLTAAYFTLLFFPPWAYWIHGLQLDDSWQIALHLAKAKGLVMGSDVIFTYGPLFWITTRSPIGIPQWWYILLDFLVLTNLFVIFYQVFKEQGVTSYSIGFAMLFSFPLLAFSTLTDFFVPIFFIYHTCRYAVKGSFQSLILAGAFVLLLALYKINTGVTSFVVFTLVVFFKAFGSRADALKSLPVWGAVIVLFLCSGSFLQVDIPKYLIGGFEEVKGYTNGFSTEVDLLKPNRTIVLQHYFSFFIALALAAIATQAFFYKQQSRVNILLLVVTGIFFYASYKHMSIRGNPHTLFVAFNAILMVLVYFFDGKLQRKLGYVTVSLLIAAFSLPNLLGMIKNRHLFVLFPVDQVFSYFSSNLKPYSAIGSEDMKSALLPEKIREIVGQAEMDVFPTDVAALFYSGMNYSPRPTIQSYNSYTPYLDNENYKFYLSEKAPEYVLINKDNNYEVITGGLDYHEGLTKIALLRRYNVVYYDCEKHLILMRQNRSILPIDTVSSTVTKLGYLQALELSSGSDMEMVSLDISYSLLGRLANFAFKAPNPYLIVTRKHGETEKYRVQPSILPSQSNFGLSRLSLCETPTYYDKAFNFLEHLKSIRFSPIGAWAFRDSLVVRKTELRLHSPHIPTYHSRVLQCETSSPVQIEIGDLGVVDTNGKYLRYNLENVKKNGLCLELSGWAFLDGVKSNICKKYLTMKSDSNMLHIPLMNSKRPDVTAHFGVPIAFYDDAGFAKNIVLRDIDIANYKLGLTVKASNGQTFTRWFDK